MERLTCESIGGGFRTDALPWKITTKDVANERGLSDTVLSHQQHLWFRCWTRSKQRTRSRRQGMEANGWVVSVCMHVCLLEQVATMRPPPQENHCRKDQSLLNNNSNSPLLTIKLHIGQQRTFVEVVVSVLLLERQNGLFVNVAKTSGNLRTAIIGLAGALGGRLFAATTATATRTHPTRRVRHDRC